MVEDHRRDKTSFIYHKGIRAALTEQQLDGLVSASRWKTFETATVFSRKAKTRRIRSL